MSARDTRGCILRRGDSPPADKLFGFQALLPEDYTALPQDVASTLALSLSGCDTYVGLFAWRRGTLRQDELAAITEQEFRLARHYGLRRLVFIDHRADAERDPLLAVPALRIGMYPTVPGRSLYGVGRRRLPHLVGRWSATQRGCVFLIVARAEAVPGAR